MAQYSFQDLERVGQGENARMNFIIAAIAAHKSTRRYRDAQDAEAYYAKHNVTMERFQKFLYTAAGEKVPDLTSANYKLKTGFFRRAVTQQVMYVLGNGITFQNEATKVHLGRDFDNRITELATHGCIDGVAFAFFNRDHIEIFSYCDTPNSPGFVPLGDNETGAIRAGIRYWILNNGTRRYTLYEEDGYTEYIQVVDDGEEQDMRVLAEKRAYILNIERTVAGGIESIAGQNYDGFPIVPFYANDLHESELISIRDSIDCMDFIKSGLANEIDDTAGIYWVLKNAGGMDDLDLSAWLHKLKQVRAIAVNSEDGGDAVPNTIAIPYEARAKMLEILEQDMYRDFQIMNVSDVSASSKTATEIRAAYQPQDDKCAAFEYQLIDTIHRILALAGIDDEPSFNWNRIANQTEETQMIMTAASVLGDEMTIKKLPFLTPEEVQQALAARAEAGMEYFRAGMEEDNNGDIND